MKKKIKAAIEKRQQRIAILEKDDNPQTIATVNEMRGAVAALEAVLEALYGNNVFLNIMAEK